MNEQLLWNSFYIYIQLDCSKYRETEYNIDLNIKEYLEIEENNEST